MEARRYAAMVTMVDRQVGEVLALLKELNLEQDTLVCFSGDNGANDYFASPEYPRGVHSGNKHPATGLEFRGRKTTLYEGGLRVPFVARWPGRIAAGTTSDHVGYFPDVLPTIAELTGVIVPAGLDGLSIVPTLFGTSAAQKDHDYLYWEFMGWTAVRQGTWRVVKPARATTWELYDLSIDPGETKDLAAVNPALVAKLTAFAAEAHAPAQEGTFTSTERHERDRSRQVRQAGRSELRGNAVGRKKKKK